MGAARRDSSLSADEHRGLTEDLLEEKGFDPLEEIEAEIHQPQYNEQCYEEDMDGGGGLGVPLVMSERCVRFGVHQDNI